MLLHPILINAYVYYDENGNVCHENWGDDINYYFLREIIKCPVVMFNHNPLAFRLGLKNYLCIGSVIDMLCKPNSEVWGAGIIDGNKPLIVKPKKVYAVRGPLTRQKLLSEGVDCPEIYGDPALLTSLYYKPHVEKKYRYGFISHVSNKNHIENLLVDGKKLSDCKDILVIDLRQYNHWHDIIDQICSCDAILSSSLHGLIISEAYKIQNVWIEFGQPLIGGHFKFHDFFLSVGRDRAYPLIIGTEVEEKSIQAELALWEPGTINLNPLIKTCPFKLKKPL